MEVQLRRVGGKKSGSGLARVYAPRFPKVRIVAPYQHAVMHTGNARWNGAGVSRWQSFVKTMVGLPHTHAWLCYDPYHRFFTLIVAADAASNSHETVLCTMHGPCKVTYQH